MKISSTQPHSFLSLSILSENRGLPADMGVWLKIFGIPQYVRG
jgi:hypothetical protein